MVEFALVLILKEVNERRLYKTSHDKDDLRPEKVATGRLTEVPNNVAKVSPLQEMKPGLKTKEGAGLVPIIFLAFRPGFFADLPLIRKLDIFAFFIYSDKVYVKELLLTVLALNRFDELF